MNAAKPLSPMSNKVTNIVIAGLGGQGVLKASDILAEAALRAGWDVKKSELHGMSQRGGSVSSDVRFGTRVLSPMVPWGEADYLVILEENQVEPNRHLLRSGGVMLTPDMIDATHLGNKKALNIALLGRLSHSLDISEAFWLEAIRANLPEKLHELNAKAFSLGRIAVG
jgi:indolepyruvate ferredoxin oxidoreductase beta subunit